MIKTPLVRRGIMGWKLSKISDKNSSTSHNKGRKKGKKHHSAFRNVSGEILRNSIVDGKFDQHIFGQNLKKNSHITHDRSLIKDDEKMLIESNNNQIINLKAPHQFDKEYHEDGGHDMQPSVSDKMKTATLHNSKGSLSKGKNSVHKPHPNIKQNSKFGVYSRTKDQYKQTGKLSNISFNMMSKEAMLKNLSIEPDFIDKYEIGGLHSDSSKLILTESRFGPNKAGTSLGIAMSSVLMGDTPLMTPQNLHFPKIKGI